MFFEPDWLIYVGAALLLLAYAIRDELRLRVLIVLSTVVYIAYYYLVAAGPLWGAIATSVLMITVNFWVLAQIILERTTLRMTDDERQLFAAFDTLTPGQFRRITEIAKWHVADQREGIPLTHQGKPRHSLFYIFDGTVSVEKSGRQFSLPQGNFVGEVAFIVERNTTATTIAPQGLRYVEWASDDLRKLGVKHEALRISLNALLTRDLAYKLIESYRPDDLHEPADKTVQTLEAVVI